MKKNLLISTLLLFLICIMSSCGHKHQWSEWQSSKDATCTQDGINMRVCDDCGERQSIPVNALGHIYSDWSTTKEASCTQAGVKERICSCGEKESETIYPRGYHNFSNWSTTIAPNCSQAGLEERTCWDCGEKESETIAASHVWEEATCTVAKHCSVCNYSEGAPKGHNYIEGVCNECDEVQDLFTIAYPSTTVSRYDVFGCKMTSFTIENVAYKMHWASNGTYRITMYVSGEKTYDSNGSASTDSPYFSYEIFDENGYLIERGLIGMYHFLKVGEKTVLDDGIDTYLDPNIHYTINLVDYYK